MSAINVIDIFERMNTVAVLKTITIDEHKLDMYGTKEDPFFLAVDVARVIDYSVGHTSHMLNTVDPNEKILLSTRNNSATARGSASKKWFLTEYGLYEVLMQSRKPIARKFKSSVKDILHNLRMKGEGDFEDWFNHSDPWVDDWEVECRWRDENNMEEITFEDFLRTKGYTDDMLGDD